jgi:hypothetical protein
MLRRVTTSSARRLILTYVALAALGDLVVLLPGGPSFESGKSVVGWVVFEALLVWLLWHRSRLAWALLIVVALLTVPFILLSTADTASLLVTLVALGQAVVLVAPSMLTFIWSRRRSAPAASL